MRHPFVMVGVLGSLLLPGAGAQAATLRVDDDGTQCPTAAFADVQQAVDAAADHDLILVCAGSYPRVQIDPGKDHLTLRARGAAVFEPDYSGGAPGDVYLWDRAVGTNIEGFHFGGPTRAFLENETHPCATRGLPDPVRLDGTSTVFRGNSIENWLFWSTDYYDDQGELVGGEWGWCQAAGPSLTVSGRASVLRNQIDYTGTTGAIRITGNGTIRDNDLRMSNEYDEESGFGPTFQHSVIDVLGIATIQRNEILGSPSPNSGHAGVAINIHGAPGSIVGAQNSTVAGQGNVIDSPIEGREFRATGIRVASGRTRVGGNHIGNVEGVGILAESGSDGSSFFENAVMGGYPPCRDETSGYRTAGTANRWYANATNADPDSNASEPPGICPPANSP